MESYRKGFRAPGEWHRGQCCVLLSCRCQEFVSVSRWCTIWMMFAVSLVIQCCTGNAQQGQPKEQPAASKREAKIRNLIEQLVFEHEKASETPLLSPGIAGNDDKEYKR